MSSAAISLLVVAILSSFLLSPHLVPTASARHVAVLVEANDGVLKNIGGRPPAAGSPPPPETRTTEMRAASTAEQQHRDAAAQMHGMLARDYAGQHNGRVAARRRPPVHNGEPRQ